MEKKLKDRVYLDNIIFNLQRAGGISVVWSELIKHILSSDCDLRFIEYDFAQNNIFRNKIEIPSSKIISEGSFSKIFSQFFHPKINLHRPFIFHSSYFRICKNPNAINVTTVHDFIYEQSKMTLKQKLRTYIDYKAILQSDAVVCISENTKKDLMKYIPNIDEKKIYTIYNGVSDEYWRLDVNPLPQFGNYLLFVGGRQGYKNFDFLINALARTDYKLLVCGQPLSIDEQKKLDKLLGERYINIIYPTNEELNKIYNSVEALVYPSSYEGFGLPILEAQRAGCPVIALNSSSIPEVMGKSPLLLNELSDEELLAKLNYLKNQQGRREVVDSGLQNSQLFSWQKMAEEYIGLYHKLLNLRS